MKFPSPFFSGMRRSAGISPVAHTFLLFLFLIIVVGPLAALGIDLIQMVMSGSAPSSITSLLTERRLVLLLQSLGFAAAVAAAGIGAGILVATALWRKSAGFSLAVLLLVIALAPVPPYIHALTWSSAISVCNQWLALLGAAPLPATGWVVSFWVQFVAMLPVAIFLSCIALASVDRTLVEAARMMISDRQVLRAIILPLAAPTLLAAFGILTVLSCTDYSVPSLFGSDTYALDIFATYSSSGSSAGAIITAIPLLIITLSVMSWCRSGIRRLAQTPNWITGPWHSPPEFTPIVRIAQEGVLALLGIQILVTLFSLILSAGTLSRIGSTIQFSVYEIQDSLLIAICTILIALPLAFVVSRELLREDFIGSLWWGIILVPLALPAPLIGIGLISLWNNPAFAGLYGTFLMPVFASVSRFAPFAAVILFVQIRSIDKALFDAARIFSRDALHTTLTITVPLLAPGLIIASAVLGALTLGELGATLIVTPPGFGTLAIKIYNYLHYGAAAEVAGLCLVMVIATFLAGLTVMAMLIRQQRACARAAGTWRGENT